MNLLLVFIGVLLLLISLAAIGLGLFMAADPGAREQGRYFALWWVPAAAAAAGLIMRDGVTFLVGLLCFLVAGAVLAYESRRSGPGSRRGEPPEKGKPARRASADGASERTTKENTAGRRRRRAS